MSIQPGIGYDIVDTPQGQSLVVNFPDAPAGPGPEQFQVALQGNDLYVAKGRVIARSSPNSFTGGCLKEYAVQGFAVFPVGSFTDGTDVNSPYVDDGGYVTLDSPLEEGPSSYGVYLIRNQYTIAGSTLNAGTPYLAVMAVGLDAETKTKPWGGEAEGCDGQTWRTLSEELNVSIESPGPPPWYEPTIVSGYLGQNRYDALYNYNCQRVKIASIEWDEEKLVWVLTQHLIGTLTLPYNIFYGGQTRYESTLGPPPSWYTTTYYDTQQTDWEGAYSDCTKWDGTGFNPTLTLNV